MKKLKLDLNELAVETFATDHGGRERGTVAGHATNTCITARCDGTRLCTGGPSCDGTCYATCGDEPCNSQGLEYCGGTAYENSCAGGDCFHTDNENTCEHTCLNTCTG
jgi:hypothetical protein